jgi:hypothetical protein
MQNIWYFPYGLARVCALLVGQYEVQCTFFLIANVYCNTNQKMNNLIVIVAEFILSPDDKK